MCCFIFKFSNQFFTSGVKKWNLIALRLFFFKKWKITICHVLARADIYYNVLQTTILTLLEGTSQISQTPQIEETFFLFSQRYNKTNFQLIQNSYSQYYFVCLSNRKIITGIEHSSVNQNIYLKHYWQYRMIFYFYGKRGIFFSCLCTSRCIKCS